MSGSFLYVQGLGIAMLSFPSVTALMCRVTVQLKYVTPVNHRMASYGAQLYCEMIDTCGCLIEKLHRVAVQLRSLLIRIVKSAIRVCC